MNSTIYQDVTIYPYANKNHLHPELFEYYLKHPDTSPAMRHLLKTGEVVYPAPIIKEEDVAD